MINYDRLWYPGTDVILDLQLREGVGTVTHDWGRHHIPCTLTGAPTWVTNPYDLPSLDFVPGNPDYILSLAADSGDLNFTSGAFSAMAWIIPDLLGNRYVFCKSDGATGWTFYIDVFGAMAFTTHQAGPTTQSTVSDVAITIGNWYHVAVTRSGAVARIYINGVDRTLTAGTHVNPASAAALNLYIGVYNLAAAGWYDGDMWRPRVFGRALTQAEINVIFSVERRLFGV